MIKIRINDINDEEELNKLLDENKPETVYQQTVFCKGNSLVAQHDTAIYTEDPKMETGTTRRYRQRYKELEDIEMKGNKYGYFVCV